MEQVKVPEVDYDDDDEFTFRRAELLMSKFSFMSVNRINLYLLGGAVSRTFVAIDVGPKMWEARVTDGGAVLKLDCEWPYYVLKSMEFNGKWLEGTADGCMGT